jgi:hypothetical protein
VYWETSERNGAPYRSGVPGPYRRGEKKKCPSHGAPFVDPAVSSMSPFEAEAETESKASGRCPNLTGSVAVTAYDQWDNVKTDYNPPNAVFPGLGNSPNGLGALSM